MLQSKGELKAISVTGIPVNSVSDKYAEESQVTIGNVTTQKNGLIVEKGIFASMDLNIGDIVQILIPQTTQDLTFKAHVQLGFPIISGVLSVGGELDNQLGLMHLETASEAIGISSESQGIQFTLNDPFSSYDTMRDIGYSYPQAVYMSDWTRTQGHLYNDIQLVRAWCISP